MDWELVIGTSSIIPLLNASIRLAMPIALASVGETFSERAGVINLGLEGIMLCGALAGFLGAFATGSIAVGALCGIGAGIVVAAITAGLVVGLRTDQVITGISIVLVAQGVTVFIDEQVGADRTSPPLIEPAGRLDVPLLGRIPGIGTILFQQTGLFYVSIALVVLVTWLLARSRFGLWARAAGERPDALASAGVSIRAIRAGGLVLGGALGGLGGALVTLELGRFVPFVTAGRGWVAIALVIFGRWNPLLVFAGSLLFGFLNALQLRVQAASGGIETAVPFELFQAMPYLATLVVLVATATAGRRNVQPAALGRPFDPDQKEN